MVAREKKEARDLRWFHTTNDTDHFRASTCAIENELGMGGKNGGRKYQTGFERPYFNTVSCRKKR